MTTYTGKTFAGDITIWNNDQVICEEIRKGKVYEEDMIKSLLIYFANAHVILDIGAHVGCHTVSYGFLNKNATIYSFEPQKKIFELLQKNVSQNGLSERVILNNCCVGNISQDLIELSKTSDSFQIEYGTNTPTNLGGVSIGVGGEHTRMITIDSLNLQACDFMKIDVEGAERLVVHGAMNTITKFKPVILFESNDKTLTEEMKKSLNIKMYVPRTFELLRRLGYSNIKILPHDNFLAIHDENLC